MNSCDIRCQVIEVIDKAVYCNRRKDCFVLSDRTPAGMCARAFTAIQPVAIAMRLADISEGSGLEVCCPSRNVIYRLEYLNKN